MNWFRNLRFTHKLGLLLLPGTLAFIGLVGWSIYANRVMDGIDRQVNSVVKLRGDAMMAVVVAMQYTDAVADRITDTMSLTHQILAGTQADIREAEAWIRTDATHLEKPYHEFVEQVGRILKIGADAGEDAKDESQLLSDMAIEFETSMVDYSEQLADRRSTIRALNEQGMLAIVLFGGVMIMATLIVMRRVVVRPLREVVDLAGMLAQGDLTHRVAVTTRDEFGELKRSLNQSVEELQAVIRDVAGASHQLEVSSEQMSVVTKEASTGVLRQQSETDQVATAMNEMSATVQEMSRHASETAQAAEEATMQSNDGKQTLSEVIASINSVAGGVAHATDVIQDLKSKSTNIGSVIDVITAITEQTNLLALNAAIEAARAGEAGRGFAVVADEVRTLARRTQESASEIQQMIEEVQKGAEKASQAMEDGHQEAQTMVGLAQKADTALNGITGAVNRITDMSTQIACATEQQGAVAEEINRNLQNIREVADQNAGNARKTDSSGTEISTLSDNLQSLIARFSV